MECGCAATQATLRHQDKSRCAVILDTSAVIWASGTLWPHLCHLLPEWHIRISHVCFQKNSHCAVLLVASTVAWNWGGQALPGYTWSACCLNYLPEWLSTNCGQIWEYWPKPVISRSYK